MYFIHYKLTTVSKGFKQSGIPGEMFIFEEKKSGKPREFMTMSASFVRLYHLLSC